MKKLLLLLALVFSFAIPSANAQFLAKFRFQVPAPTSGACAAQTSTFALDSTNHTFTFCDGLQWNSISGGGGTTGAVSLSCAGATTGITYQCVADLTATQINHLFSSPVSVVAAPGAGKVISLLQFSGQGKFGTIQAGPSSGDLYIRCSGTASGQSVNPADSLFESSASQLVPAIAGNFVQGPQTDCANKALVLLNDTADPAGFGAVATSSITPANAGAAYANNDLFNIDGCGGTDATGKVVTNTAGAVATYSILTAGHGYVAGTTGCTTTATTGIGTGLQLNINTITPGDGVGRVWVTYTVNTLR